MYHVTYFVNVYYCFFISAFSLMHVFLWMFVSPDPRPLALSPKLYSPALGPNLYLPALAYNFIASPEPEFAYTDLVS